MLTAKDNVRQGAGLMMTPDEACALAAELLAAVVESTGLVDVSRFSEEVSEVEHARTLLAIRAGMLATIVPSDGMIVEVGPGRAFYCDDCSAWIDVPAGIRRSKSDHRVEVHTAEPVPA